MSNWKIFFLSDLLDRRAEPKESGQTFLDIAKVFIPSIVASVTPIYGPISDALNSVPGAARIIRVLVPVTLCILCVYIIVIRAAEKRKQVGFGQENARESKYYYRFTNPIRQTAKLILIPLLCLAAYEVKAAIPNKIAGRERYTGYICGAIDGNGIEGVLVDAQDRFGKVVSVSQATTDDTGYFVLAVKHWDEKPASIRVQGTSCQMQILTMASGAETLSGCPAKKEDLPPRPKADLWRLVCKSSE
jgi:hypothetical protein